MLRFDARHPRAALSHHGVFVLFVQNLALGAHRTVCSKVLPFADFGAVSDFANS
jgi:hypothetical protein